MKTTSNWLQSQLWAASFILWPSPCVEYPLCGAGVWLRVDSLDKLCPPPTPLLTSWVHARQVCACQHDVCMQNIRRNQRSWSMHAAAVLSVMAPPVDGVCVGRAGRCAEYCNGGTLREAVDDCKLHETMGGDEGVRPAMVSQGTERAHRHPHPAKHTLGKSTHAALYTHARTANATTPYLHPSTTPRQPSPHTFLETR